MSDSALHHFKKISEIETADISPRARKTDNNKRNYSVFFFFCKKYIVNQCPIPIFLWTLYGTVSVLPTTIKKVT